MTHQPAHYRTIVPGLLAGVLVSVLLSMSALAAQGPARPVAIYQFNSDVAEIPPHVAWNAFSTALVKTGIFTVVTQNPAMAQYAFEGFVTEVKAGQGKVDVKGLLKGFFVNTSDEQSGVRVEIKVLDVKTGQILDTIGVASADLKSKFGLADVGSILQGLTSKGQSSSSSSTRPRKDVMDEAFANCIVEAVNKISPQAAQYQNMASAIPPPNNQQAAPAFSAPPPMYGQQPAYNPSYNQPPQGYPAPGYPGQAPPPGYPTSQPPYGYPAGPPQAGFPPTVSGPQGFPSNQPPAYGYPPQMAPAVGAYPPPAAAEHAYPPNWGGPTGAPQPPQPGYGYPSIGPPQGGPTTGAYPPPPPGSESGYPPTAWGGAQGYPSNQPAAYGHPPGANQSGIPEYPSAPPSMPSGYGGQPGYPPNAAGGPGYPQAGYPPQQMPPGAAYPPQGGAYPPQGQAAPPPGWR